MSFTADDTSIGTYRHRRTGTVKRGINQERTPDLGRYDGSLGAISETTGI